MKKIVSFCFALLLTFSAVALSAFAYEDEYDPELVKQYEELLKQPVEREPGGISIDMIEGLTEEEARNILLGVCAKLYPNATEAELDAMVISLGPVIQALRIKEEDMVRAMLLLHDTEEVALFELDYIYCADQTIGDVNGDERVDVLDYLLVKRYYLETLPEEVSIFEDMADYNRDGKIDFLDYLMIKKVVLAD